MRRTVYRINYAVVPEREGSLSEKYVGPLLFLLSRLNRTFPVGLRQKFRVAPSTAECLRLLNIPGDFLQHRANQ